ncbi:MAG TPA: hypothetical protein VFR63_07750 [Gaiellaceae bacterium]|jgi:hypothetical protein|nr:hypothetical protein [Gaiellaceae bacterium]
MRNRRRIRLLRRLAIGLAVAALVAPAAQAGIPASAFGSGNGTAAQSADESGQALPRRTRGAVLHGDDKALGGVEGPAAPSIVLHGDDKVLAPPAPAPEAIVVSGDDKAGLPEPAYVPFVSDFPRTSPNPGGGDWTLAGYRRALPQDYGIVPVEVVRSPSAFDWGDGLIGAGSTLALLVLLGGATLATRRHGRPAAA